MTAHLSVKFDGNRGFDKGTNIILSPFGLFVSSLNWQHQLCKNPRPNPDIKTLFVDHTCTSSNGCRVPMPSSSPFMGTDPKGAAFPPFMTHNLNQPLPFQPTGAAASSLAAWMTNPNSAAPHATGSAGPVSLAPTPNAVAFLKRPRTPSSNGPTID